MLGLDELLTRTPDKKLRTRLNVLYTEAACVFPSLRQLIGSQQRGKLAQRSNCHGAAMCKSVCGMHSSHHFLDNTLVLVLPLPSARLAPPSSRAHAVCQPVRATVDEVRVECGELDARRPRCVHEPAFLHARHTRMFVNTLAQTTTTRSKALPLLITRFSRPGCSA